MSARLGTYIDGGIEESACVEGVGKELKGDISSRNMY